jgi:hypothetical protein
VPYVRTVKTKSGATAVQVVWSSRCGSREIEHIGSAHDDAELDALKAAAGQRIAAGQPELGLGLGDSGAAGPLPITSSRMGCLPARSTAATGSWAWTRQRAATGCSGSWCSRGSSSRPARSTALSQLRPAM